MGEGLEGWGAGFLFLRDRIEVEGLDEKGIEEDDLVIVDFLLRIGSGFEMESAAAADLDVSVEGAALGWAGFLTGIGFGGSEGLVERAASVD